MPTLFYVHVVLLPGMRWAADEDKKMIELHNAQLLCRPPPDYEENALPKHLWLPPTLKNLVHPPHCSCSCSLDTIPNNLAEAPSTSVTLLPPVWFRSLSPMCQSPAANLDSSA